MKTPGQAVFRFGDFVLLPSERLLLLDGKSVAITGKAFDLLATLVENAGHLVSKDELLRTVWRGVVVEEVNLSVNISALRKVLSTVPDGAQWIETVPRQGYRFNARVEAGDIAANDLRALRERSGFHEGATVLTGGPHGAHDPSVQPERRRVVWVLAGLSAVAVAAIGGFRLSDGRKHYSSVAVLPFIADQASDEYFADGLVEGLINEMTRLPGVRVTPRASAFRFKDAPSDLISAGHALNAAAVVTGSLSRRGDGARLQVELVDVAQNARVWRKVYDAVASDLPKLEARLTEDLADAMQVQGSEQGIGTHGAGLRRRSTTNEQAYQAYLQGRFLWNQRSEASLQKAIEHFRRAVDLDPLFSLAYAGLADAHTTLGYLGYVSPVGSFAVARPYALEALELDPSLAQPHASLAYIKFYFDWDWEGARKAFTRGLELNPNDPVSHQWYAVYLLASGQPERAFGEIQRAHHLDPLSLAVNTDIGFHHYYNGRNAEAVAQLQTVLGMKSDFLIARLWLARSLLELNRFDDALAETSLAESKAREWSVLVAARGHTYGVAGMTDEAQAVLGEMEELSKRRFVTAYGVALVYAGLARKDEAFDWLERAFEERSHWLVWLRLDPRWKSLRDDPRFKKLIHRMKYPA